MPILRRPSLSTLLCCALLVVVSGTFYYKTLQFDFSIDDPLVTYQNKDIRNFDGDYWLFFTTSFYHGIPLHTPDFLYRPLSKATLAWDYQRAMKKVDSSGQPDPSAFHQTNIVLYSICLLVIFFLIRTIFRHIESSEWFALGAALLFSVFPAHVTVVSNIKHREEILACLFGSLAFWLYALHRKTATSGRVYYLSGSCLAYLLAIFSKESALFFLPALVLYELSLDKSAPRNLYFRLKNFIPFLFMIAVWYGLRTKAVGHRVARNASEIEAYSYFKFGESVVVRLLTEAKVFVKYYFWDALVTQKINPLFNSRYVVLTEYTPSLQGILSFSLILIVILTASYLLWRGNKREKQISFWVLFFFTMLFPVANIVRIDYLGGFRFLFTPSLSYCVLIMMLLSEVYGQRKGSKNLPRRAFAVGLFVFVFGYFSYNTLTLAPHWKNNFSRILYATEVEDGNPLVWSTLGHLFAGQKKHAEKVQSFQRMVSIIEHHPQSRKFIPLKEKEAYAIALVELAHNNLWKSYELASVQIDTAISLLHELEPIMSPTKRKILGPAYYVAAKLKVKRNLWNQARQDCRRALAYYPSHQPSQNLLRMLTRPGPKTRGE